MGMKIKAVIFDMFETLITHFEAPVYMSAQIAEDIGVSQDEFRKLWYPTEDDRTLGHITFEETLEAILNDLNRFSDELMKKIVSKRVSSKYECFNHLHKEIIPMLEELKSRGIKIGLISNCFSEEVAPIRESILASYFDEIFLSCEQGLKKPDKEIYQRCMDALDVLPEECLYVGDGGSHELETACELAMKVRQAVWYLKEGTRQPVGRLDAFEKADNPLEIVQLIDDLVIN